MRELKVTCFQRNTYCRTYTSNMLKHLLSMSCWTILREDNLFDFKKIKSYFSILSEICTRIMLVWFICFYCVCFSWSNCWWDLLIEVRLRHTLWTLLFFVLIVVPTSQWRWILPNPSYGPRKIAGTTYFVILFVRSSQK